MNPWRRLLGGATTASGHMTLDRRLADEAALTVRLFTWARPAVTWGWRQTAPAWLAQADTVEQAERPTGGGVAVHGSDVAVAVIVPRVLALPLSAIMAGVCGSAVRLCRALGVDASAQLDVPCGRRIQYCLTDVSPYAVTAGGRKLAGFAIRRLRESWLVQGSVLLAPLPEELLRPMPADVRRQLAAHAVSVSDAAGRPVTPGEALACWRDGWSGWWPHHLSPDTASALRTERQVVGSHHLPSAQRADPHYSKQAGDGR